MDLVRQEDLTNLVRLLELGQDPNSSEAFHETLSQFKNHPHFLFALLRIIADQTLPIPLRFSAASIMRNNIDILQDPNLIDQFIHEAQAHLLYVLRLPPSYFVREIAALVACIYLYYNNRTNLPVFADLNTSLSEIIQIPELCENALDFGIELSSVKYTLNTTFVSFLPHFIIGEFSEKAIYLCSLLYLHTNLLHSTVIPILFQHLEQLSPNAIASTCRIVKNILSDQRSQPLIEFAIMCLLNPNDNVAFEAIEIFEYIELIPYQNEIVVSIFRRLGNDFDLTVANVSTSCLRLLRKYYLNHRDKAESVLLQLLQTSTEDSNELKCIIRCYSILKYDTQQDLEMAYSNLTQLLATPFCCDAAYSITTMTKRNPNYFPQSFSAVFMVLQSDSLEIRLQIYQYLTKLCMKIDSKLPLEKKAELQSEPFLGLLLTKLCSLQSVDDEFFLLMRLMASYCNILQVFTPETFLKLTEVSYQALTANSSLASECVYVFSSIINKIPETFIELLTKVAPIVLTKLKEDNADEILTKYSVTFFTKSIEGASKFQLINHGFNGLISEVCNVVFQFINPSSAFPVSVRLASWDFFYTNLLFNTQFLTPYLPTLFHILSDPSELHFDVIGLMCQFVNLFFSHYKGNEFDDFIPPIIYNVCIEGLERDVDDGDHNRQSCAFCLLKLLVRNPAYPLCFHPDLIQAIINELSDFNYIIEHINDEGLKLEFTQNLRTIIERFPKQEE